MYRYCNIMHSLAGEYPVPVDPLIFHILNIIQDDKNVGSNHLVEKTRIREVMGLVYRDDLIYQFRVS